MKACTRPVLHARTSILGFAIPSLSLSPKRPSTPAHHRGGTVMSRICAVRAATLCTGIAAVVGCASIPKDQMLEYAQPKAVTKLTVVQTLGCAPDPDTAMDILSAVSVTPTTNYVADNTATKGQLSLGSFRHDLVDPDLDVSLTDDGRLKSINATMTGSGTAVVKATIELGALIAALGGTHKTPSQQAITDICHSIQNISNSQNDSGDSQQANAPAPAGPAAGAPAPPKPPAAQQPSDTKQTKSPNLVTLTYELTFTYTGDANGVSTITPDASMPASQALTNAPTCTKGLYIPPDPNTVGILSDESPLRKMAGSFCISIISGPPLASPAQRNGGGNQGDFTPIDLPRVFSVTLVVSGLTGSTDPTQVSEMSELWRGVVTVPIGSAPYQIMVPTGTAFGTEKFALQLADNGTITELHYGASGGASDVGTAFQAVAQALPTNASKASDLSDQSDLIYEQQRLLTCKLTPAKCASK